MSSIKSEARWERFDQIINICAVGIGAILMENSESVLQTLLGFALVVVASNKILSK